VSDALSAVLVLVLSVVVIGGALALRSSKNASARDYFLRKRRPIAITSAGALIALTGVGMFVHARLLTTATIDLAAAEAGAPIDGDLVVVEGHARPESTLCRDATCYTPVTSTPDGRVVATLVSGAAPPPGRGRFEGFVTRSNEHDWRLRLEATGLEPADDVVRLLRESREDRSRAGSWVALAGLGLLIGGAAWLRRDA